MIPLFLQNVLVILYIHVCEYLFSLYDEVEINYEYNV
jgi:hypothetical protein